jgi:hypothetical protein
MVFAASTQCLYPGRLEGMYVIRGRAVAARSLLSAFYLHDKVLLLHGRKFPLLKLILVFPCQSDPPHRTFIIMRY